MGPLSDYLLKIDYSLLHLINTQLASAWGNSFFPNITDLHKILAFQLIAYPLLLLTYYLKYKKKGVALFFGLVFTLTLNDAFGGNVVKKYFQRPRPFQNQEIEVLQRSPAGGYSFYSNHAANMTAFATYTTLTLPALAYFSIPAAILVSYSRIYNGVHYPSDVFCGALVGLFFGWLISQLARKYLLTKAGGRS